MNDPHYSDGFYDNEDDFFMREEMEAEYRDFRESEDEPAYDDEFQLEDGDWDAIAQSERDGYGYFDPNEGCYDD